LSLFEFEFEFEKLPKMLLRWFRWKKEEKDAQAVINHSPHNKEKYKMVPSIVKLLYHENGGSI